MNTTETNRKTREVSARNENVKDEPNEKLRMVNI